MKLWPLCWKFKSISRSTTSDIIAVYFNIKTDRVNVYIQQKHCTKKPGCLVGYLREKAE